jgi:hypothetical protein
MGLALFGDRTWGWSGSRTWGRTCSRSGSRTWGRSGSRRRQGQLQDYLIAVAAFKAGTIYRGDDEIVGRQVIQAVDRVDRILSGIFHEGRIARLDRLNSHVKPVKYDVWLEITVPLERHTGSPTVKLARKQKWDEQCDPMNGTQECGGSVPRRLKKGRCSIVFHLRIRSRLIVHGDSERTCTSVRRWPQRGLRSCGIAPLGSPQTKHAELFAALSAAGVRRRRCRSDRRARLPF